MKTFIAILGLLIIANTVQASDPVTQLYDYGNVPHYDLDSNTLYLPEVIVTSGSTKTPYLATVVTIKPTDISVVFTHDVSCGFSPYYSICEAIKLQP